MLKAAARGMWRGVVFGVGVALCLIGIALLVLPGPGLLVLFLGLALLATEFRWAKSLLEQGRARFAEVRRRNRAQR
ncbi:MAG TPA: PGPGW domain-containing protein [Egibacteraceae bacterium]|nr:PGPGW domain-containing protein [Egibacteraceae bacterium]